MTSGPLYHYFPNKSELVRAAAESVTQMAATRFIEATHRPGTVVDRLVALLEESDQLIREYPQVAAFDYAIRLESPRWLNLQEATASVYQTVLELIVEIVAAARENGTLDDEVDVDGASRAIYGVIRGLTEMAATTPPKDHHATLSAAKSMIRGTLFATPKIKRKR